MISKFHDHYIILINYENYLFHDSLECLILFEVLELNILSGFVFHSSVTLDGDGSADVNGDGKVDVADIAKVIDSMAGQTGK